MLKWSTYPYLDHPSMVSVSIWAHSATNAKKILTAFPPED